MSGLSFSSKHIHIVQQSTIAPLGLAKVSPKGTPVPVSEQFSVLVTVPVTVEPVRRKLQTLTPLIKFVKVASISLKSRGISLARELSPIHILVTQPFGSVTSTLTAWRILTWVLTLR
eukprot:1190860-Prorocentrum_minimum.AAC.6